MLKKVLWYLLDKKQSYLAFVNKKSDSSAIDGSSSRKSFAFWKYRENSSIDFN